MVQLAMLPIWYMLGTRSHYFWWFPTKIFNVEVRIKFINKIATTDGISLFEMDNFKVSICTKSYPEKSIKKPEYP